MSIKSYLLVFDESFNSQQPVINYSNSFVGSIFSWNLSWCENVLYMYIVWSNLSYIGRAESRSRLTRVQKLDRTKLPCFTVESVRHVRVKIYWFFSVITVLKKDYLPNLVLQLYISIHKGLLKSKIHLIQIFHSHIVSLFVSLNILKF